MAISEISFINLKPDESELITISSTCALSRRSIADASQLLNEAAADIDPGNLFMRMFYLLSALGQNEMALDMQADALKNRSLYRIVNPVNVNIRVLAFMGAGDMTDNTPIDFLIENSDIRLDLLFISTETALPISIPEHDVAFVALGESDKNNFILDKIAQLLLQWPRPFINHPVNIKNCARHTMYEILQNIPGLLVPKTYRVFREEIGNYSFPMTVRPIDTHGGRGFEKLENSNDLKIYLDNAISREFYVAEFIDYQSTDGNYRKLRIALIDKKPYICHLAIADKWMVHYVTSGMEFSTSKREEEQTLMESFESTFALRHRLALYEIAERLKLDYVVIDCAERKNGELLLFEVDPRCWVHATDSINVFPYKQAIMQIVFDAFRDLLFKKALPSINKPVEA